MSIRGHSISFSGALVSLICFFLPWMTVSCGQKVTTLTGIQLALGGTIPTNMEPEKRNGDIFILLALLAAVAAIVVVILAWRRGAASRTDGYWLLGLGGLALLILAGKFASNQTDTSGDVDVIVQYHAGFWGAVLGYVLVFVGGVISLLQSRNRAKPTLT